MVRTTATGSALTRTAIPGVGPLYRALETAGGGPPRPFSYVSSSAWNLHGFLVGFLRHRDVPLGPLLRDLGLDETKLVESSHGDHKLVRIAEVLELHPGLDLVLVGDSGQHDPQIYARIVEEHPGRVRAVWIREVRLDPTDGTVEEAAARLGAAGVTPVVSEDATAFAEHAVELGLLAPADAAEVASAVTGERAGTRSAAGP